MPYVSRDVRAELRATLDRMPENAGELNFLLTSLVDDYLMQDKTNYQRINEVIGVLECAKLELYRRIAVPYEDKKKHINGDVYLSPHVQPNQVAQNRARSD